MRTRTGFGMWAVRTTAPTFPHVRALRASGAPNRARSGPPAHPAARSGALAHPAARAPGCGRLLAALLLLARPLAVLPAPLAVHELTHDPHELGRLEGLGEEGVDAGGAALPLVFGAGTDDRHGEMTGPWIGPQASGGLQPVQTGHDDIEGDDIRTDPMHDIQTLGTIGRGHDLEPLEFEIDPDQLADHPVVIDNEHPPRHA